MKDDGPKETGQPDNRKTETAAYVGELTRGLRVIIARSKDGDFAFLDYLLAMAETEASEQAKEPCRC